jgi:DNA-binding CsgD family transcriptional regulator
METEKTDLPSIETIVELNENGKTLNEIAKMYGTSREAIVQLLNRNGVRWKSRRDLWRERILRRAPDILALARQGLSPKKIAATLRMSPRTVKRVLAEQG